MKSGDGPLCDRNLAAQLFYAYDTVGTVVMCRVRTLQREYSLHLLQSQREPEGELEAGKFGQKNLEDSHGVKRRSSLTSGGISSASES